MVQGMAEISSVCAIISEDIAITTLQHQISCSLCNNNSLLIYYAGMSEDILLQLSQLQKKGGLEIRGTKFMIYNIDIQMKVLNDDH